MTPRRVVIVGIASHWGAELARRLERDPGIEAAADDLYATVMAFVTTHKDAEHGSERRDRRVVREAFLRLEAKLAAGRPSDNARALGLD